MRGNEEERSCHLQESGYVTLKKTFTSLKLFSFYDT